MSQNMSVRTLLTANLSASGRHKVMVSDANGRWQSTLSGNLLLPKSFAASRPLPLGHLDYLLGRISEVYALDQYGSPLLSVQSVTRFQTCTRLIERKDDASASS